MAKVKKNMFENGEIQKKEFSKTAKIKKANFEKWRNGESQKKSF